MSKYKVEKYPIIMRVLHWAMALIILSLIGVGFWMVDLPKDYADRGYVYSLHKSFGVTILILIVLRFVVRMISKIPPLPASIPAIAQKAAHGAHLALYVLILSKHSLIYSGGNIKYLPPIIN